MTVAELFAKVPSETERIKRRLHVLYDQRLDVESAAASIAARRAAVENDAAENAARRESVETEINNLLAQQRAHFDSERVPDDRRPGDDPEELFTPGDDAA